MKVTKFLFLTLSLITIFGFTPPTLVKSTNQAKPTDGPVYFSTLSSPDCSILGLEASWGFPATSILIQDVTSGQVLYNGPGNNKSSKKFGAVAGHVYYVDVYNIGSGDTALGYGSPECSN